MSQSQSSTSEGEFVARAQFLGVRADTRELERGTSVGVAPLTLQRPEGGRVVIFRFGAVVSFGLTPAEDEAFIDSLAPCIEERFEEPEREEAPIVIDAGRRERLEPDGRLVLRDASVARLQVVAHVLAKSTVLAHYEEQVAEVFDRVEELADQLRRGRRPSRVRTLLREIGDVLLIQVRTVGRAEVAEKPEITWEEPDLDRLYERLATEYELRDRDLALSRKLDLISRTAETYLDLVQTQQAIRVEWLIVLLIFVEIVLILYDIFSK